MHVAVTPTKTVRDESSSDLDAVRHVVSTGLSTNQLKNLILAMVLVDIYTLQLTKKKTHQFLGSRPHGLDLSLS